MSALRVALCGNPNVGKSTVFNALTGLRQHTGNWAGKTVDTARGLVRGSDGGLDAHGPAGRLLAAQRLTGGNGRKRLPDL